MKIQRSAEWERIDRIERRDPFTCYADVGKRFHREGGTQRLLPAQQAALCDVLMHGGLLGGIGVGEGKTLVTLLAPRALGAERPLLLLPAGLIDKTLREAEEYARHWCFTLPTIVSYERLARVAAADLLDEMMPDVIVADEAQHLRNHRAAATRRVFRYVKARNKAGVRVPCVLVGGTLTRKSVLDYWHLSGLALRNMPLPRSWPEAREWADALDEGVEPWARPDPGPLLEWGPPDEPDPIRRARLGYQKRLRETPGVVCTSDQGVGVSLQIGFRTVDMPDAVARAMAETEQTWTRPDGYEFCDALSRDTIMRQLALGFYYRWKVQPPREWRAARAAWCAFVRETCHRSRTYDTEQQVALACKRGALDATARDAWVRVRDTFKPETECVWLDNFALVECCRWMKDNGPSLVWTEHKIFGQALANWAHNATINRIRDVEFFGEGGLDLHGKPIEMYNGHAVVGLQANYKGRNLQAWSRNLVTSPPSACDIWEQLLGRTHRNGQQADTVYADVLVTHPLHVEAFARAREGARYPQDTLGQRQKLLYADVVTET